VGARAGMATAVLSAALACPAAAAARENPVAGEFFGLNVEQLFMGGYVTPDRPPAYVSTFARAGIRTGRVPVYWDRVEPNPPTAAGAHAYDWRLLDVVAGTLARRNVRMTLVLSHTPRWASSGPEDASYASYPPRSAAQFAAFARAVASRYGSRGAFWRARPALAPRPALTYEIWNEHNHAYYWKPAPDPAAYVRVYDAARAAIRGVDRAARVLVGGIVWNDDARYIRGLYAAGGRTWNPDGLALHPYANQAIGVVVNLRRVHHTLRSLGRRPPLYLTELGWVAVQPGEAPAADSDLAPMADATRAGVLSLLADAAMRSDCDIRSFVVYDVVEPGMNLYDAGAAPNLTGSALAAAVRRYPDMRDGSLGVCGAPSPVARLLRLTLDPRAAGSGCFAPFVSYRGFPIERARVFFASAGGATGIAHTNGQGVAAFCAPGHDATRPTRIWAEVSWEGVPAVARSADHACSPACAAVPGTGPRVGAARGAPRMALRIRPRRVPVGSRVRLVFSLTRRSGAGRVPVAGGTIHFEGLRLRTNGRGRVAWRGRYARPGRHRVIATKLGAHRAVGWVVVVPRR
jgi:hypothetical protein